MPEFTLSSGQLINRFLAVLCACIIFLAACDAAGLPGTPLPTGTPPETRIIVTLLPPPTQERLGIADHTRGAEDASLNIVMYGDFQCAPCVDLARALLILQQRYPADVRVTWRHFPQPQHDKAQLAAQASEAAAAQGKFWPLHDHLLADQANWRDLSPDAFRARLGEYARQIGLPDPAAFEAALAQQTYAPIVELAIREARAFGFVGAPALLFRDEPYSGRIDEFALDNYVRFLLLEKRHFASQPPLQIDLDKQYQATLVTEKGNVVIDLYVRDAPVAVNNFVFLARQGWYNNITFHLVTPELAQTGDPSGSGLGTAGYYILDEHDNGLIFDREGVVAMSAQRGVPNSASSQFFITYGPLPPEGFNGQYTIFGQVVEGMDVLRSLTLRNPFDELHYPNPPPGDRLIRVEIAESGP